ncbi:Flagellar biosynthesis pathway, component FlhA [Treponema sp. JC4]|uniref:FHIPEP family type III secretion protein n=1 Tax=Treponema sp. JC4 TaxID=1124982 RepID=UPI00025AFD51|nr:FHIPEP family type III secretion protein [Treponema sp. JC4]EID85033.1 Flagellar biosynthesis pathway, component FlhA [Treponema sp. JC4]
MKVRNYDNEIYKRFREELPDILELRFGSALRPLIEGESPLFREINYLRNWIHAELGFILPKIRIRDWLALNPNEYVILINGFEVARYGEMGINDYMCINTTDMIKKEIAGTKTKDPAFDLDAIIITKGQKKKLKNLDT